MQRKFLILLFSVVVLVSSSLPASFAANSSPDLPVVESDAAAFYFVHHELEAKLNASSFKYDGKTVKAASLIMKNGRLYFPIRWLQSVNLGTVQWDAKTASSWVKLDTENESYGSNYRFISNKPYPYYLDNGKLQAETSITIPAPFIKDAQMYIPVKLLQMFGVNYEWKNGVVRWSWNDKVVKVLQPTYTTQEDTITFTVLTQKETGRIYSMQSTGIHGLSGGPGSLGFTDKQIGESIKAGGKEFIRTEFTLELRSGYNPYRIHSNDYGSADILIYRQISESDHIPIRYHYEEEHKKDISFTKPSSGYYRIKPGESIEIAGKVLSEYIESNNVGLQLSKLQNDDFQNNDFVAVGKKIVMLLDHNNEFEGMIAIDEPGSYLINIMSPDVFVGGSNPYGSVKWAEIVVEVE